MTGKTCILIVDDNEMNRMLLKEFVDMLRHETVMAVNGLDALEIIRKKAPDVILLDMFMPNMDGHETLRRIRAMENAKHIPVIMISAHDDIQSIAECLQSGADDYLVKPFNPTLLKARIAGSLDRKKLYERNERLLAEVLEKQKETLMELNLAKKVQQAMLPDEAVLKEGHSITVEVCYQMASEVGGDFYQVFRMEDGRSAVLVADVTGHGSPAALIVSAIKAIWDTEIVLKHSPSSILTAISDRLCDIVPEGFFATIFIGLFDPERHSITYSNAGHPLPVKFGGKSGEITSLEGSGMMAGCFKGVKYSETSISFEPGEKLLVFSDGAYEIPNRDGSHLGLDNFYGYIRANCNESGARLMEKLFSDINSRWDRSRGRDDITLLLLEYTA